ncbi:MAG: phosphoenolpyruvate--protein phosphotransferase [Candidatus Latescibacteria bacterium]|nr:phosphoenolpyruvate--protein phosphotransferase [Candidatus Latescibacterota bacterium]
MKVLKGIQASNGIAIGPVYLHNPEEPWVDYRRIGKHEVDGEVRRFLDTLASVAEDLKATRVRVEEKLGPDHAQIFDAHLMILDDAALRDPTLASIRNDRVNVEYAFWLTLQKVRRQFDAIQDDYFRARRADILDVERRVLSRLCQREDALLERMTAPAIVIARELTPSNAARLKRDSVLGMVTEAGAATSHASIIARGLEIPAVVGVEAALASAEPGDTAIVDGNRGLVCIRPDADTLSRYRAEARRFTELQKGLLRFTDVPAETLDGVRVCLQGNIELPEEGRSALAYGAEGIGLFRTEYLYLAGSSLPGEAEQTDAYTRLAEQMAPHPLVVRTLDLGGDKLVTASHAAEETNPFLGWRAIRHSLANRDLFRVQLKSILRSSAHGNVKLMFPMISGVEELLEAKYVLAEARAELKRSGVPFDEGCEVGAVIEVPSAAVVADQLAREVSFFSIGTNDLVQYTLAVDRGNERVAYLYDPYHPAVLRLIKSVVDAGHRHDIPVTVCGEMAADPHSCVLLMGLGVDGFSAGPRMIPEIKQAIRSVTMEEARAVAEEALALPTRGAIREFLYAALTRMQGPRKPLDELEEEPAGIEG